MRKEVLNINNIILYSTGCVKCKELKDLLNKFNIQYIENNSVDEMIKLGFDKVPMLGVNGSYMNFKDAKTWIEEYNRGEV